LHDVDATDYAREETKPDREYPDHRYYERLRACGGRGRSAPEWLARNGETGDRLAMGTEGWRTMRVSSPAEYWTTYAG
jgi:hypothetical protein